MASRSLLRPRVLAAGFGVVFLLMAIVSWYFANGAGSAYTYGADVTRWSLAAYLIAAAALLAGVGGVSMGTTRSIDRRLDELERESGLVADAPAPVRVEETVEIVETSDVPPPLEDAPEAKDHVDQDIDELLVSLQEMETVTEESDAPPEEPSEPESSASVAAAPRRKVFPSASARSAVRFEALKHRRESIPAFFAGPALTSIAIIAITAALLPGADSMLQSWNQLNTAVLLGIGYSYGFVALYAALSIVGILRSK